MLNQNTFPDFFEEKVTTSVEPKTDDKVKLEDIIKLNNQRIDLLENHDKKSMISIVTSCVSGFLLLISGWLIINLQLWAIPFFLIVFVLFVSSNIFSFIFKTSRNIIWVHLLGIGIPYFIIALFTGSILTGSAWLAGILILFLIFIAFLEMENSLILNRVFIFKSVIYQTKKLLILSGFLLVTFGAYMGINAQGGPQYIENTIDKPQIYKSLFDPSVRTALLGRAIINERLLKAVDGTITEDKKPLTFQDFLMLKTESSSISRQTYYDNFADKTYCKASPTQSDDICKDKLNEYAKLTLANLAKSEFGVDTASSTVKLTTPMTKDTIKTIIKRAYAHNLEDFINSKSSATNPLKIYSILGKNEGISLFISTILFLILLATFTFYNLITSLTSWLIFKKLKKDGYLTVKTSQADVEYLEF